MNGKHQGIRDFLCRAVINDLDYLIKHQIFADDIQAIQSAITQVATKKLQRSYRSSEDSVSGRKKMHDLCSIFSSSQERASLTRRRTRRRVKVSPSLSLRVRAKPLNHYSALVRVIVVHCSSKPLLPPPIQRGAKTAAQCRLRG